MTMDRETEDKIWAFGMLTMLSFGILVLVALIFWTANVLFGMTGVIILTGIAVLSVIIAGVTVWLMEGEL